MWRRPTLVLNRKNQVKSLQLRWAQVILGLVQQHYTRETGERRFGWNQWLGRVNIFGWDSKCVEGRNVQSSGGELWLQIEGYWMHCWVGESLEEAGQFLAKFHKNHINCVQNHCLLRQKLKMAKQQSAIWGRLVTFVCLAGFDGSGILNKKCVKWVYRRKKGWVKESFPWSCSAILGHFHESGCCRWGWAGGNMGHHGCHIGCHWEISGCWQRWAGGIARFGNCIHGGAWIDRCGDGRRGGRPSSTHLSFIFGVMVDAIKGGWSPFGDWKRQCVPPFQEVQEHCIDWGRHWV